MKIHMVLILEPRFVSLPFTWWSRDFWLSRNLVYFLQQSLPPQDHAAGHVLSTRGSSAVTDRRGSHPHGAHSLSDVGTSNRNYKGSDGQAKGVQGELCDQAPVSLFPFMLAHVTVSSQKAWWPLVQHPKSLLLENRQKYSFSQPSSQRPKWPIWVVDG